jgi:RNA polymerase sigma factor (sigma-70 family)
MVEPAGKGAEYSTKVDLTVAQFRELSAASRERAATALIAIASAVMGRIVRARVLQTADAEDVAQDLALRVLEGRLTSLDRVRASELLMSHWIRGVFERRGMSLWRARRRSRHVESMEELAATTASTRGPANVESPSVGEMERDVIENLPPRERAIVEARVADEPLPAIAARLGISERSVQRGWMRALQRVRAWRTSGAWGAHATIAALPGERLQHVSERQREVYRLARAGLPRSRIAARLGISSSTVSNDLARLRALARGGGAIGI